VAERQQQQEAAVAGGVAAAFGGHGLPSSMRPTFMTVMRQNEY
jgi:hypothetical protein